MTEYRVIGFNIHCSDKVEGNSIAERAPRLEEVTKKLDADLIGFQEFRPTWEEHIQRIFGEKYGFFHQYRSQTNLESCPVLWKKDRFDCLKKGVYWFSDTPEVESQGWDEKYAVPRIFTYCVLKDRQNGREICFISTHFGFGDHCQVESARVLKEYCGLISSAPTVIVGDFNMTPSTLGYAAMAENFSDVNALTVNDRRNTYHGYHPEVKRSAHIDYCFVNSAVSPLDFRILNESVDGKYPSDHFGILANVGI